MNLPRREEIEEFLTLSIDARMGEVIKNYFPAEKDEEVLAFFKGFSILVKETTRNILSTTTFPKTVEEFQNFNLTASLFAQEELYAKFLNTQSKEFVLKNKEKLIKFKNAFAHEIVTDKVVPVNQKHLVAKKLASSLETIAYIEGEFAQSFFKRDIEHLNKISEQYRNESICVTINIPSRVIWQKDTKILDSVIDAISNRNFSPKTSEIKNVFQSGKGRFSIHENRIEHFVWLLSELYHNNCYKVTPKKGHLLHFEQLLNRDYLKSSRIVPFKKIVNKIKNDTSNKHAVKSMVSTILRETKISQ